MIEKHLDGDSQTVLLECELRCAHPLSQQVDRRVNETGNFRHQQMLKSFYLGFVNKSLMQVIS